MAAVRRDKWILYHKQNPDARLRLFYFPYAGGGASVFRNWAENIPPQVEVCSIQLPGREYRISEPLFNELLPIIQSLYYVFQSYMELPFIFFGHSLGALICFELIRELRKQNQKGPLFLFVSGARAPQIPNPYPSIHQLEKVEFIKELRRLNGTNEEVLRHEELLELLLPILRADLKVSETYKYKNEKPLNCKIFAFGGLQDPQINQDEIAGWEKQTDNQFSLKMFPGDHFFLNDNRKSLLNIINQELIKIL
jgi:medium-chain acyl-[acyl-carrier-protein] hydrolase